MGCRRLGKEENPCAVGSGRAVEIWPGYPFATRAGGRLIAIRGSGPLLGDLTLSVEYRFGLMPDLIWPIDAGSDGPNLSVPLRRVLLSKEPPTFLGINPQSTLWEY
jgi:hypothetical protein